MKKSIFVLALSVIGIGGLAFGAIVTQLDSGDFTWKYEFTSETPDVADLDGNLVGDFNAQIDGTGSAGLSGGVLSFSSGGGSGNNAYYYSGWGAGSKLWDVITDLDLEHGVTMEMRVKVLAAADEGSRGVIGMGMMPDGTDVDSKLLIGKTTQYWGGESATPAEDELASAGTIDNTDGFHNFRIALDPDNNTYSVWRDAELLASGLGDTDARDGLRRSFIGNFATSIMAGDADVDYLRITPGAYAAVPEPATLSLFGLAGLVCVIKRRWFSRH